MDLLNTLKKFKDVEPDRGYAEKSRSLILSAKQKVGFSGWGLILKNLELGATFVLAGVLILLMLGGFSPWKSIAPLQISNLDPAGLKAEADAIDIQIQLMNLNYAAGTEVGAKSAESTPALSGAPLPSTRSVAPTQDEPANTDPNNAPTSTAISVDEALKKLAE